MTKLNENYNKVFSNLKNAGYSIYSYQEEAIKWISKKKEGSHRVLCLKEGERSRRCYD